MAAIAPIQCNKCHKGFDGTDPMIRVKKCGDTFHKACFFNGEHITLVNNIVEKVLCPNSSCKQKIVGVTRRAPAEDVNRKIEIFEFPKPPAPPNLPQQSQQPPVHKETRGIKYIAYFAAALLCITMAGVTYPSWIALGIGAAISIPIGYWIGKKIEQYHAKSP